MKKTALRLRKDRRPVRFLHHTTHHSTRQPSLIRGGMGLPVGPVFGYLVFILAGSAGDSLGAFAGFLAFVAWIGLPLAAYFDMQYIRANAKWNPNTGLWVILLAVWLVNIVAGAVYLYRRHEVLGVP